MVVELKKKLVFTTLNFRINAPLVSVSYTLCASLRLSFVSCLPIASYDLWLGKLSCSWAEGYYVYNACPVTFLVRETILD